MQHHEVAIDEERQSIESGFRPHTPHSALAAAYALDGKIDAAKSAMAEACRLNPKKLTVKRMAERRTNDPEGGVTDFDKYRADPTQKLASDFFVPDNIPVPPSVKIEARLR